MISATDEENPERRGIKGSLMAQISVLVVDDEPMIRLLIQDMLDDLGHTLAGEAARIDEALKLARQAEFDVAILDVDLNGQPIWPVAEVLVARGLPFVFATGYGQRGVPEPYRGIPTLGKPFDADALEQAIEGRPLGYSTAVPHHRAFGSEPHRGASCVIGSFHFPKITSIAVVPV